MKIIIPQGFHAKLANKHLLLDTSFFIDSSLYQIEFTKLIDVFKENNTILTIIDPVRAEFLKGSESPSKLKAKNDLIDNIIDHSLPLTPDIVGEHLHKLVEIYKEKGKGVSICDLLIGATLQKYSRDLLLVTKNGKDFPKPSTQLFSYFLLDLNQGLQVYSVLSKGK